MGTKTWLWRFLRWALLPKGKNERCMRATLTSGPHRGPFVTQQISVWHMVHITQSHPSFFCTTMLQRGQRIASPLRSIACQRKTGLQSYATHQMRNTGHPESEIERNVFVTVENSISTVKRCTWIVSCVCFAATSLPALIFKSSWYSRQSMPSWIALHVRQFLFLHIGQVKKFASSS